MFGAFKQQNGAKSTMKNTDIITQLTKTQTPPSYLTASWSQNGNKAQPAFWETMEMWDKWAPGWNVAGENRPRWHLNYKLDNMSDVGIQRGDII